MSMTVRQDMTEIFAKAQHDTNKCRQLVNGHCRSRTLQSCRSQAQARQQQPPGHRQPPQHYCKQSMCARIPLLSPLLQAMCCPCSITYYFPSFICNVSLLYPLSGPPCAFSAFNHLKMLGRLSALQVWILECSNFTPTRVIS